MRTTPPCPTRDGINGSIAALTAMKDSGNNTLYLQWRYEKLAAELRQHIAHCPVCNKESGA